MSKHTIDQHYQTQKPSITAPEHLDEAIISQAKSAVQNSDNSAQPKNKPWLMPLSTAATVAACGLTFLLVFKSPSELTYEVASHTTESYGAVQNPTTADMANTNDELEATETQITAKYTAIKPTEATQAKQNQDWVVASAPKPIQRPISPIVIAKADMTELDSTQPEADDSNTVIQGSVLSAPLPKMSQSGNNLTTKQSHDLDENLANNLNSNTLPRPMIKPAPSATTQARTAAPSVMPTVIPPVIPPSIPLNRWAKRVIELIDNKQIEQAQHEYKALKATYPNADEHEALKPYIEKLNTVDE